LREHRAVSLSPTLGFLTVLYYSSYNPFLDSLPGSIWNAFTDLGLGPDLVSTGVLFVLVS